MYSLKRRIAYFIVGLTAGIFMGIAGSYAQRAHAAFPVYNVGQGGTGSTTLTGILKGNGTSAIGTAIPGTDYQAPVSATSPITFLANSIACLAASGSQTGCLTSGDWASFNARLSSTTLGLFDKGYFFSTTSADAWGGLKRYLTGVSASAPLSGAGTGASPLVISQATASTNGYLSSTDWNAFNARLSTTTLGLFDKGFFFSTTSADWWGSTKGYLTSLAGAASSTLHAEANTFSGLNRFTGGLLSIGSTTVNGNATTTGMQGVGSLFLNGSRFTSLLGTGLRLVAGALGIDTTATFSWTGPHTFSNTVTIATSTISSLNGTIYVGTTN
jgi:hypothetical protein